MAEGKHMMYMNILICGSDSDKIIKLENQLEEIGNKENIKINIDTNSCMRQRFIQDWLPENYDILFINLDNKENLCYAKKIRLKDERVHIVLLSENQTNIQDTFEIMPTTYLVTPVKKEELEHWIKKVREKIKDQRLYVTFNYRRKTYHIPYQEIWYLESQRHKIHLVTKKGTYTFYGKLSKIQEQMKQGKETFLRIHQSYLINSRYVYCMDGNLVQTWDGREFSVSGSYREKAKAAYRVYLNQ